MSSSVASHINDYYNNTSRDAAWGNFTSSSPDSLANIIMNATYIVPLEYSEVQDDSSHDIETEIELSEKDFNTFESIIANPPEANKALKKLMGEI